MDLTTCPECGNAAEVVWRAVLESTDGPVEHVKVSCVERHWFLLPVAGLSPASCSPSRSAAGLTGIVAGKNPRRERAQRRHGAAR